MRRSSPLAHRPTAQLHQQPPTVNLAAARQQALNSYEDPREGEWTEEAMRAAGVVCRSFTRMALMVRYDLIPRRMAMDLWAIIIIEAWEQVQRFVLKQRKAVPLAWSQFEWLYQQATEHRRKYFGDDRPTARITYT
jgi:hypothetical protein